MHQLLISAAALAATAGQEQAAQPAPPQPPVVQAAPAPTTVQPTLPTPTIQTAAQPGKIVMYRGSSIMGMGIACPIRYKEQQLVELARGKFAEWVVPGGRYVLTNHTSSVEVTVDPGETRYIRCMIKPGFLAGRADLQIVDAESFMAHRNEFEQKPIAIPSSFSPLQAQAVGTTEAAPSPK